MKKVYSKICPEILVLKCYLVIHDMDKPAGVECEAFSRSGLFGVA